MESQAISVIVQGGALGVMVLAILMAPKTIREVSAGVVEARKLVEVFLEGLKKAQSAEREALHQTISLLADKLHSTQPPQKKDEGSAD